MYGWKDFLSTAVLGWQVQSTVTFVPKVVSFLLMLGARRWYIVGAYVPPKNVPAVHCVDQALKAAPKGLEIILMGELNVRLRDPHEECEEDL